MLRLIATTFALALVPAATWAESNTLTGNPGFFKPTPDGEVALTKIEPPRNDVQPAQPQATPEKEAMERVREAEADIDHAERQHEKAAQRSIQSATTIEGAVTGLTSDRDR